MSDYWKNYIYEKKDDTFLKQLASDIHNNLIFTSQHLPLDKWQDLIDDIFIGLCGHVDVDFNEAMTRNKISFVYEYFTKAGHQVLELDGVQYPVFTTYNFLNQEDAAKVVNMAMELKQKS